MNARQRKAKANFLRRIRKEGQEILEDSDGLYSMSEEDFAEVEAMPPPIPPATDIENFLAFNVDCEPNIIPGKKQETLNHWGIRIPLWKVKFTKREIKPVEADKIVFVTKNEPGENYRIIHSHGVDCRISARADELRSFYEFAQLNEISAFDLGESEMTEEDWQPQPDDFLPFGTLNESSNLHGRYYDDETLEKTIRPRRKRLAE